MPGAATSPLSYHTPPSPTPARSIRSSYMLYYAVVDRFHRSLLALLPKKTPVPSHTSEPWALQPMDCPFPAPRSSATCYATCQDVSTTHLDAREAMGAPDGERVRHSALRRLRLQLHYRLLLFTASFLSPPPDGRIAPIMISLFWFDDCASSLPFSF